MVLYYSRDYDASIKNALLMLRKDPSNGITHCLLFSVYFKKQSHKEAIDEFSQCFSLYGYTQVGLDLKQTFAASGYQGAMRQFAKDIENLQATKQVYLPGNLAVAYMLHGDTDRSFHWLEQAYEHREMIGIDAGVCFLGCDPMFDPLRSDRRFKDLLRRVGLPQ